MLTLIENMMTLTMTEKWNHSDKMMMMTMMVRIMMMMTMMMMMMMMTMMVDCYEDGDDYPPMSPDLIHG